jgi:hypothetical protein
MNAKPLYQYIFDMLDYADVITAKITPEEHDKDNYFMTLVYVEDILDKYARGLVLQSATESGQDGSMYLKLATDRMDGLRRTIRKLSQLYDFDEILRKRGDSLYQDWHKLPADHPNLANLDLYDDRT